MRTKRKILSLLLCGAMLFFLCPQSVSAETGADADRPAYSGGSGTEADPWLISSVEDLQTLAETLNSGKAAEIDADADAGGGGVAGNYYGYYFKQTCALDLSAIESWDPIGYSGECYFAGNYDGGGYSISGMKSTGKTDGDGYATAGLFGWVAFGSVSNVHIRGAHLKATGVGNYSYAGGIAGVVYGSAIINCSVFASAIESARDKNNNCAGGIVGYSTGGTFDRCEAEGNTVKTMAYGGGFVGEVDDDYGVGKSTFTNCYVAKSTITAFTDEVQGISYAGEFAGEMTASALTLKNCFVYGNTAEIGENSAPPTLKKTGVFAAYLWPNATMAPISAENCYYCTTAETPANTGDAEAKSTDEFADGTVRSLLGDAFTDGTEHPVLAFVYPVKLEPDGGTITEGNAIENYTRGKGVILPTENEITREGYTFEGWYTDSDFSGAPVTEIGSEETGDKAFYAKWVRNAETITPGDTVRYIVEHYQASGDKYILADTEYLAGKIGDTVTAIPKTYTGYTYNPDAEGAVAGGTLKSISSEDDIVTLRLYYELAVYVVTLDTGGGTIADGRDVTGYTYGEGAALPTADDMAYEGYTFQGWYEEEDFSGSAVTAISDTDIGDRTFHAKWVRNTVPIVSGDTVRYIVKHYKEDSADGMSYALAETEYLAGKIGETVKAEAKDYEGYCLNEEKSVSEGTLKEITEEADILTLKLYYDEILYSVTVQDSENGTAAASHTSAAMGTKVTLTAEPDSGYRLAEWQIDPADVELDGDSFVMPAADVTVMAVFEEEPTESELHTRIEQTGITEVPEGLKNAGFDTVEQIIEEMTDTLLTRSGYSAENVETYDVRLRISRDGGQTWEDAEEDDFPAEGIRVVLPYPSGTGRETHEFVVTHMFTVTSKRLGTTAGQTEQPAVTKTEDGLEVTLNGLSPVAVAWKAIGAQETAETEQSEEASCNHLYEWKPETKATAEKNAVEVYECIYCGRVSKRMDVVNSAYAQFNKDAVEAIDKAPQDGTVKLETKLWVSFQEAVIETLKERPDVTAELSWRYQGKPHGLTIPAGADLEVLEDAEGYYGFLYLELFFGNTETELK